MESPDHSASEATEERSSLGDPRTILMQLMGFPKYGDAPPAKTVQADWPAVIARLQCHPEEADEVHYGVDEDEDDFFGIDPRSPLLFALQNEITPLTVPALEAFIEAHAEVVKNPRSKAFLVDHSNPKTNPDVIATMGRWNPHGCTQPQRTGLFQIMGFDPDFRIMESEEVDFDSRRKTFLRRLASHPEVARIVCPVYDDHFLFPLEALLGELWGTVSIDLSTVHRLVELCPAAVTYRYSEALYRACVTVLDHEIVLFLLRANPALAAYNCKSYSNESSCRCGVIQQGGLPLHAAVHYLVGCKPNNPSPLLQELIAAHPAALQDRSFMNMNPLQVGLIDNDLKPETLRILLEEGRRYGVFTNTESDQLLHRSYDLSESSMNTMKSLLQEYCTQPSADRSCEFITFVTSLNLISPLESIIRSAWRYPYSYRWQNYCLAVQAAGAFKTKVASPPARMWQYPLLHAVIEHPRPSFLDKVFREHASSDINRLDGWGRTALVVAIDMISNAPSLLAETRHSRALDLLRYPPILFPFEPSEDDKAGLFLDEVDFPGIVAHLLDNDNGGSAALATRAALSDGRLPLHHALSRGLGLPDGLCHILKAHIDAVAVVDPVTGLLPFLLAAVGPHASVAAIFACMMARPNLLANLVPNIN